MTLLLIYVGAALTVSFICSILEAILLSITPSHIALLEQQKHPAAPRLRALKENVDRPLAAILSLNTVAHTVGAAGAGAQAAKIYGDAAVGIFSAILTFAILVLTEIIPKTLGAVHWKALAPIAARGASVLILIMWPLVKLAQWLTRLLTPRDRDVGITREELSAMADEGAREGVVEQGESRLLKNLLRFSRLCARDIMTPSEHVLAMSEDEVVGVSQSPPDLPFSRIPIYTDENGRRSYTGYVLKDELLAHAAHDAPDAPLAAMRRELLVITDTMKLPEIFDRMVERREHIALVKDDADGMKGVVTMEDVVETLLGLEIFDEVDDAERIQELAREHWRERARRLGRISDAVEGKVTLGITGSAAGTSR